MGATVSFSAEYFLDRIADVARLGPSIRIGIKSLLQSGKKAIKLLIQEERSFHLPTWRELCLLQDALPRGRRFPLSYFLQNVVQFFVESLIDIQR